jgi:hypothetical protein
MLLANWLGALLDLARRETPTSMAPLHQSVPALASAALKPGAKTWLVARAVSLRAF